jgi:hypothetical protein
VEGESPRWPVWDAWVAINRPPAFFLDTGDQECYATVMDAKTIAEGNDLLRETMIPLLGRVVMTAGVAESPDREQIITQVREFKAFSEDNDPRGEHDFGNFEINGVKYYFKIDYYDANYHYGADPYTDLFRRVLTILRADEY